jgi:hypothetical protein
MFAALLEHFIARHVELPLELGRLMTARAAPFEDRHNVVVIAHGLFGGLSG